MNAAREVRVVLSGGPPGPVLLYYPSLTSPCLPCCVLIGEDKAEAVMIGIFVND